MKKILIVDGYNMIYAWPELKNMAVISLEDSREKLCEMLDNYGAFRGIDVILVFDAGAIKGASKKEEYSSQMSVIYSAQDETADEVIEKMVLNRNKSDEIKVYVATSDWAEQKMVLAGGAYRLSALELLDAVKKTEQEIKKKGGEEKRRSQIHSLLNQDVLNVLEKIRRRS